MEIAIDCVGLHATVAVSDQGRVLAELTWPTGRRHTPTLVPAIADVCRYAEVPQEALTAVFVDVGPGAYGGIRAGMAAAIALAIALEAPVVGVHRLEIDAYAQAPASGSGPGEPGGPTRQIVSLHRAGRGQWALARYQGPAGAWRELQPPTLVDADALEDAILSAGRCPILCGDTDLLRDDRAARLRAAGAVVVGGVAGLRRAGVLAELGWRRLQAGGDFHPDHLQPLYLREPAIGPQPAWQGED